MKFGEQLKENIEEEWREHYIDYEGLKDIIDQAYEAGKDGLAVPNVVFEKRTAFLSVQRNTQKVELLNSKYTQSLAKQIQKLDVFILDQVRKIREELELVDADASSKNIQNKQQLRQKLDQISKQYSKIEKFVNINYEAVHKIAKKQDKVLPQLSTRLYFVQQIRTSAWARGDYSDILVKMSKIYTTLRGDAENSVVASSAQAFVRQTSKYWVPLIHVTAVKNKIIKHLPVYVYDDANFGGRDAQWVNSVYFDNEQFDLYSGRLNKWPGAIALRIRWYGEDMYHPPDWVFVERKTHHESWTGIESVKERFEIRSDKVVPFLTAQYTPTQALADLAARPRATPLSDPQAAKFTELFTKIQSQVQSKRLKPTIRTQYQRTAFQLAHEPSVRISMDTNLIMFKESWDRDLPDSENDLVSSGKWHRDASMPMCQSDMVDFPHAVLEVKLALREGQAVPPWVQALKRSGYLNEVHKFSKFIHGTALLWPTLVEEVPYWVDDASLLDAELARGPMAKSYVSLGELHDHEVGKGKAANAAGPYMQLINPAPPGMAGESSAASKHSGSGDDLSSQTHQTTSSNMREGRRNQIAYYGGQFAVMLAAMAGKVRRRDPAVQKIEPKSFLANERTFLSWLNMAITMGTVAASLLSLSAVNSSVTIPAERERAIGKSSAALFGVVVLPVAMLVVLYASMVFLSRGKQISKRQSVIHDAKGPVALALLIIVALCVVLGVEVVSLVRVVQVHGGAALNGVTAPRVVQLIARGRVEQ